MPDALIRFYNGNYFNTIKASSSLASNPVFTLPINDGDNGDFFKTDGNGVISWAAITPAAITGTSGGADTYIAVYNTATTLDASSALTFGSSTLTVTGHILPGGSNHTYDLGSSSAQWRNIYTEDFHLNNTLREKGNSIDGTKGNWTIQEGAEDLFIVNNQTNKKYKFTLVEVA